MKTKNGKSYKEYAQYFSEENFWEKLKEFNTNAGREVVEKALVLFFALDLATINLDEREEIKGVLGYFIFPIDEIPDWIPGIGFSDDLEAMVSAISGISSHITSSVTKKAHEKAISFFN